MQNVSNNASSLATRQTAMSGAQTLANQINAAGQQYDALRESVNTQLSNTVSQINSYTQQIAQLNGQISAASTQGQPPNQLLDQRDLAVSNLSQLIGVQVVNSNGSYGVFMSNGQPLVSGGNSFNLGTAPSTGDSSELSVQYLGQAGANPAAAPQILPDSKIDGGTLGGLLAFRSQTLDPAEAQLGAIAVSFASQVNAQNALGITLAGVQGGALFSVGGPTVYANTQNTGNASLNVSFANPAQPTTGDYTLAYNGTGYTLTDNSTGTVVGLRGQPEPADQRPEFFDHRHDESRRLVHGRTDPRRVEQLRDRDHGRLRNRSRIAGTRLGSVDQHRHRRDLARHGHGRLHDAEFDHHAHLQRHGPHRLPGRLDGDGCRFTGNNLSDHERDDRRAGHSSATGASLTINNTTAGQMDKVSVTISGVPSAGDKFTIGPNSGANNDGRNALALSNLSTAKSMNGGTVTLTGAYANYVNDIGNQTNQIQTSSTAQASLRDADPPPRSSRCRASTSTKKQPICFPVSAALSGEQQSHSDRADPVPDAARHLPVRR